MAKILITSVVFLILTSSIVFADGLLVRIDTGGQGVDLKLFDYLQGGWTVWVLHVNKPFPALYGGRSFSRGAFSAELVPGLVFDREKGFALKDLVLETNLYYQGKVKLALVNELGGFSDRLWLWGEQEFSVAHEKWVAGIRSQSLLASDQDSFLAGPILGRQYRTVRVTLWPWRNALEWSNYGLTVQAKGFFSY